ncbi:tubulin-folding cofactor B-like [Centruroides vittatus]|uniref:tubulin-folding cofactor B-like n=1 Tax=Centruroides vittatus TaxID=120091 RepID=UPI0035100574
MANQIIDDTPEMVSILITSSINSFGTERRYPKNISISELKGKLELITGALSSSMKLELRDKNDVVVTTMMDGSNLGSYTIGEGMRIHVIDNSHRVGEFEDLSKVEKFALSDEEYQKKSDSLRAFKMKNKLGQFNEEEVQKIKEEEQQLIQNISVGNRCEVTIRGKPKRRGTVMYVGETDFKPGYWVGVQYDEPFGKNDGSVNGKRYFSCPDKYGGFVKPQDVAVGDFPEEDFTKELDEI